MARRRINVGIPKKKWTPICQYTEESKSQSAYETCYDWMKESPFRLDKPQEPEIWLGDVKR